MKKMSGSKKLTLRVQSSEGTARVELLDSEVTAQLFERVCEALGLKSFSFVLYKDRQRKQEITSSKSRRVSDCGLQHGDMLYLTPMNGALLFEEPTTSTELNKSLGKSILPVEAVPSTSKVISTPAVSSSKFKPGQEDEVDLQLYKQSGNIERQRDDKLCRHNSKGCCVHCSPLEPWDEGYLKEHNIKHMSFHSYLRKITSKNFISLDELSCKIKPGCSEHPPWPRGICSKCQPGAVTLNRQLYRHVDNVLVEHTALVERFLAYWRVTGYQRLGYLYGRYEIHPDVPLGIRACVAAIYEPAQSSGRDTLSLQPDSKEEALEELAERLGLVRIGWIFTDLLPLDLAAGTVQHIRGAETHFLSAQECIMAGHYQNQYPNVCRHASSGYFGSKFVTVCVTGDSSHRVHLEGYQVSGQCQTLVRDQVLLPTKDAPELGYIRDCTDDQYVPDVYYKERDVYGNEVGVSAKRVPVDYLLVDVPCGVSTTGPGAGGGGATSTRTTFTIPTPGTAAAGALFPPAHRPLQNHLQTLKALHQHMEASNTYLEAFSDLHVLLYLCTNEVLQLRGEALDTLIQAILDHDELGVERWCAEPQPATLLQLARVAADEQQQHIHDNNPQRMGGGGGGSGGGGSVWTCQICTYHNHHQRDSCEMCAMPRSNAM